MYKITKFTMFRIDKTILICPDIIYALRKMDKHTKMYKSFAIES